MCSSSLAALLSKSVGVVGPRSLAICRAYRRTLASSVTTFDDAVPAPSCCALAEIDSRPSPPLPSPPGGVCDLSPDVGLESVLLISAQQRTAHSFDRRCVWSRLVRVAPRWWCRWRRTRGVIADERLTTNYLVLTMAGVITRCTCMGRDSSGVITQE